MVKEEWHDAEKPQEATLRRESPDVEEAAIDEGSTTTIENFRYLESLEDSDTEDFSQSEKIGFYEEPLEQAERKETRRGTRAGIFPDSF